MKNGFNALRAYQSALGLIGLSLLALASFFWDWHLMVASPHRAFLGDSPILFFFFFVVIGNIAFRYNLPILKGYLVTFDIAITLTVFFAVSPLMGTWVACLSPTLYRIIRIRAMRASWQSVGPGLYGFGDRALQFLGATWVYHALGGKIPFSVIGTPQGITESSFQLWFPALAVFITFFTINNLLCLPVEWLAKSDIKIFFIETFKIDFPLSFITLPLGIIGASVLYNSGSIIYLLLIVTFLGFCILLWHLTRTKDRLRLSLDRLETLSEVSRLISSTLHRRDIMSLLSNEIQKVVPASCFVVVLYDGENDTFVSDYAVYDGVPQPPGQAKFDEGLIIRVVTGKMPIFVDPLNNPGWLPRAAITLPEMDKGSRRTWLGIPMIAQDEIVGVLILISPDNILFTQKDSDFILSIARQAAISLHNAQLYEYATRDELTQVFVRRYFLSELKSAVRNNLAEGSTEHTFAVALADMDNLKRFNDRFGHPKGDEVLHRLARLLEKVCSGNYNVISRYGGDEFALLLYVKSREEAQSLLEKVRQEITSTPALRTDGLQASLSFGFTYCPPGRKVNSEQLILEADNALYEAKKLGGNCCVLFKRTR